MSNLKYIMEENEITPLEENHIPEVLVIDENIKMFLTTTARWGKFLSIVGFVFCGLIAIGALFLMFAGSSLYSSIPGMGTGGAFVRGFVDFIYLLMALLYYFPSKYLYDFSVYIKQAILMNDQESLSYGFSKLKSLYRFWGILTLVILVLYGLLLLFGMAVIIFASFGSS